MKIWVDADACPKIIKEIILKACLRTKIPLVFVANKPIHFNASPLISSIQVPAGFDMADERILDNILNSDVVITADIPLADAALIKGAHVISPRGYLYTTENIKSILATRDLKEELRDFGINTQGPKALGPKDKHSFACSFDKILATHNPAQ